MYVYTYVHVQRYTHTRAHTHNCNTTIERQVKTMQFDSSVELQKYDNMNNRQ